MLPQANICTYTFRFVSLYFYTDEALYTTNDTLLFSIHN